jgi:hypothetical protein
MVACLTIFIKCKNTKYKDTPYEIMKVISIFGFCFMLFINAIEIFSSLDMHQKIAKQYEVGNYEIVEGYVENYNPLPADGKGTENFEINGVYFAYNNADGRNGYTAVAKHGGVITMNGQHLRIKYVTNEEGENIILYISEIG